MWDRLAQASLFPHDSMILGFILVKLQHNIHQKKKVTIILLKSACLCEHIYVHVSKAQT